MSFFFKKAQNLTEQISPPHPVKHLSNDTYFFNLIIPTSITKGLLTIAVSSPFVEWVVYRAKEMARFSRITVTLI